MQAIQSVSSFRGQDSSDVLREAATIALEYLANPTSQVPKPAEPEEEYLPWRYRKFRNVDFQKEPNEMCQLINAADGKIGNIPGSLWKKLTKASMYLTTLKLKNMIIPQGMLEKLALVFRNVKTVRLQNVGFRDSIHIHEVACFKKMTRLSLAGSTRVTSLEPAHLANVTVLDVSETYVDDAWLKTLQHCRRLEHLLLARSLKFTESGFKEVLQIPNLKALNVFKCIQIRPKVIAQATRTHDHIKINTASYSIDGPLTAPQKPATHELVKGLSELNLEPVREMVHFPLLVPHVKKIAKTKVF